jgi:dihydropteroate synthase-like protein
VERLSRSDLILVPGSVRGDVSVISKVVGRPVYKASKALALLPQVLRHIASGGSLDTVEPAENVVALEPPRVEYVEAFKVNGVSIPLRGPPLVISAEIVYWVSGDSFRRTLSRYVSEGAQVIVVGSSFESSPESLADKVSAVVELGYPALAEAPSLDHARKALDSGASGLIVSSESVDSIARPPTK